MTIWLATHVSPNLLTLTAISHDTYTCHSCACYVRDLYSIQFYPTTPFLQIKLSIFLLIQYLFRFSLCSIIISSTKSVNTN